MSTTYGLNGSMRTTQPPPFLSTGLGQPNTRPPAGYSNEAKVSYSASSTGPSDCRGPNFTPVHKDDLRATAFAHLRSTGEIYQHPGRHSTAPPQAAGGDLAGRDVAPSMPVGPRNKGAAIGFAGTFLERR